MKKEILELIKLRALEISDKKKQVDVCQYFTDIEFFSKKVSDYNWLSKKVSKKYHDLTIGDFVSLSDEQLSKLLRKNINNVRKNKCFGLVQLESYYSLYNKRMANFIEDLEDFDLPNDVFADYILEHMNRSERLFDAGIALFSSDKEITEKAKKYTRTRN